MSISTMMKSMTKRTRNCLLLNALVALQVGIASEAAHAMTSSSGALKAPTTLESTTLESTRLESKRSLIELPSNSLLTSLGGTYDCLVSRSKTRVEVMLDQSGVGQDGSVSFSMSVGPLPTKKKEDSKKALVKPVAPALDPKMVFDVILSIQEGQETGPLLQMWKPVDPEGQWKIEQAKLSLILKGESEPIEFSRMAVEGATILKIVVGDSFYYCR